MTTGVQRISTMGKFHLTLLDPFPQATTPLSF